MVLSWHSSFADFRNASVDAILEYLEILQTPFGFSAQVKRISEHVVLKRRIVSTEREYQNLAFVWNLCDHDVLRVPEPIRQFQGRDESGFLFGYLLMEYLPGFNVEDLLKTKSSDAVEDISKKGFEAIVHLQHRSRNICSRPGPLNGGIAKGFPWGEYGASSQFSSLQHLQNCLRERLSKRDGPLTFGFTMMSDLVLCHLDLVPRNIIITHGNVVGILDWETLAIYPPIFELAALSYAKFVVTQQDWFFIQALENHLKEVSTTEDSGDMNDSIAKLGIVQTRSIKYAFGTVLTRNISNQSRTSLQSSALHSMSNPNQEPQTYQ